MAMSRPGSTRARQMAEASLSERAKQLPSDMQSSFQRMMTEMYEQEHRSMIDIIDDARRSLAATVDELRDEQQVLSATSDKISKTRSSTATRRRNSTPRPQTSRSGIVAARHERIRTAKQRQQPEADDAPATSRPTTAAARRPTTAWTRPTTAAARPGTSAASRGPSATTSSSMDSVIFETERRRLQTSAGRQSPRSSPSSPSPTTVAAPPAPSSTILTIDDEDDGYEQETHAIMNQMSGAQSKVEQIRQRQTDKLRDRQEKKKAQQSREQLQADALCHEATALQELKLKDQERQGQLIKERIEERKRRKQQKQETSLSDTSGRQKGVFVVQVSESNNTFSSVDETDD